MFIVEILKETAFLFLEMAPYLLLGLLFVGILNLFFNKDLIVRQIGKNNFLSIFKAALFGIPLPLCSCGVVPSSVYLAKNGASKSSVVSFLIATPQTGVDSIIATYGMMGWVFAIFRPFAALFMGIIGGIAVKLIKPKEQVVDFATYKSTVEACSDGDCCDEDSCSEDESCDDNCHETKTSEGKTEKSKVNRFFQYSFIEFLDDISVQFVIGLFISGIIAYLIPEGFFEGSSFSNSIVGMLLMIVVGIPMYVCATASIPIAVTLMLKGFSPGIAFVFLAVGPATNAASFTIIMNVLGKKVAIVYVAMISVTAIIFGLLLDKILEFFNIDQIAMIKQMHRHDPFISEELKYIAGLAFLVLLLLSFYRKFIRSKIRTKEKPMESTTIKIEGMSCNHCVMNAKKAIAKVPGISDVDVNLQQNEAYIKGNFNLEEVEKTITDVGYKVVK